MAQRELKRLLRIALLSILIPLSRVLWFAHTKDIVQLNSISYKWLGGQPINSFIYFFSEDVIRVMYALAGLWFSKFIYERTNLSLAKTLVIIFWGLTGLAIGKCVDEFICPSDNITLFEIIYITIILLAGFYKFFRWQATTNKKLT